MKKIYLSLIISFGIFMSLNAVEMVNALPYLRMGVGARPLGMGGTFVGVADETVTLYWNPAGLSQIKKLQFSSMFSILSLDRSSYFIGLSCPVLEIHTLGIGLLNSNLGGLKGYKDKHTYTGEFGYSNLACYLSYAYLLTEDLSVGTSIKLLYSRLSNNFAFGFSSDLGLLFRPLRTLQLGAVLQDLFSSIGWNTPGKTKERSPTAFKIGIGWQPKEFLLLACDITKREDRERLYYAVGIEYTPFPILSARAGVNNGIISCGVSFLIKRLTIDYGFSFDRLGEGNNHFFSLKYSL